MAINSKEKYSVQMTTMENYATNLYNSEEYNPPMNQRPYDALNAASFFANLVFWAIKCLDSVKKVKALPGCTVIGVGSFARNMSISVKNGVIYIQDGQHRAYWAHMIFKNQVVVPEMSECTAVGKVVNAHAGKPFCKLPAEIQEAIKKSIVLLKVVETESLETEKAMFYDENCGSSVKTNECTHNNFCDVEIYKAITDAVNQITAGDTHGRYTLTPGADILKARFNRNTIFHFFTRVLTYNETTHGAKKTNEAAINKYAHLTYHECSELMSQVIEDACFAALIVGNAQPIHLYDGMYGVVSNDRNRNTKTKVIKRGAQAMKKLSNHNRVGRAIEKMLNAPSSARANAINNAALFSMSSHEKKIMWIAEEEMAKVVKEVQK